MLNMFTGEAAGRVGSSRDLAAVGVLNDGVVLPTEVQLKNKGPSTAPANGPAAAGFGSMLSDSGAVSPGYHHLGHAMSDPAAIANLEQSRNGRRLVGQGLMFQGTTPGGVGIMQQQPSVMNPGSVLNQVMSAPAGRPIVKGFFECIFSL
jgi:hypothetical protein